MFSRRDFLTTLQLGAVASVTPRAAAALGEPLFRIGFLTDTHVTARAEGSVLVADAMRLFREHGCGAIIHCGDLADLHYTEGYGFYRAAVERFFPRDMPHRPEFLYVHANHDTIDPVKARDPRQAAHRYMDFDEAFRDMDLRLEDAVQPHFVQREYGGLPVLVFPQEMRLAGGFKVFEERIAAACAASPGKPVIVCLHMPARGTTYNSGQWGNSVVREVFDRHPQVVAFAGHVHNSLRNERCLWHENGFTAIDVGCLQQWEGITVGTSSRSQKAYEAIVAEIHRDHSLVVRRFDVRDGVEIKPLDPWTVPVRRAPETPGTFAPRAKAECRVDAVPFSKVTVAFPAVANEDDVLHYRIEAKSAGGRRVGRCDVLSEFHKRPKERTGRLEGSFSDAFFDGGEYRFTVTPIGFFGACGRALEVSWKMPARRPTRLLWACTHPLEELTYRSGWTHDAKSAAKAVDVPVRDGWVARERPTWAVLPESLWKLPKGTRLRFTADLQMEQDPKSEGWTLFLRAMDGTQRCATGWITAPPDERDAFRAVFEFTLRDPGVPYHFGIMQGSSGRFRPLLLKLEEFPA